MLTTAIADNTVCRCCTLCRTQYDRYVTATTEFLVHFYILSLALQQRG